MVQKLKINCTNINQIPDCLNYILVEYIGVDKVLVDMWSEIGTMFIMLDRLKIKILTDSFIENNIDYNIYDFYENEKHTFRLIVTVPVEQ